MAGDALQLSKMGPDGRPTVLLARLFLTFLSFSLFFFFLFDQYSTDLPLSSQTKLTSSGV